MVLRALQWLKQHNKYYRKIDIDLAALSQLPEDGNLTGLCKAVTETNVDEEELKPKEDEEETPTDVSSFVPIVARKKTEEETIRETVQEQHTVAWPPAGDTSSYQ